MIHTITRQIDGRTVHVADLIDATRVVLSENGLRNPETNLCTGPEIRTPAPVAYSSTDAQAAINGKGALGRESFDAWLDAQIGL